MARARWWNITVSLLFLILILSIIAPIASEKYTQNMWGNVISEIWGISAGVLVAWIFLQRFRHERLPFAKPVFYDRPLRDLQDIAEQLLRYKLENQDKSCLTDATRTVLRANGESIFRRATLYCRFLEIEELADLDEASTAAIALSDTDE